MKLSYYIYYKIAPGSVQRARTALAALQEDLARATGVRGRMQRRRDDPQTWMEVYEDVEDAERFETLLAALVGKHGIEQLLAPGSARRREVFQPL